MTHINETNQSTEQCDIYTTMKSILHLFKKVEESASMLTRHWGGKRTKNQDIGDLSIYMHAHEYMHNF